MERRCDQCEWSRERIGDDLALNCCEGPVRVAVVNVHWCGRFRLAERLTGNKDVRTPDEQ